MQSTVRFSCVKIAFLALYALSVGCARTSPNAPRQSADRSRELAERFVEDAGIVFEGSGSEHSGVGDEGLVVVQLRFDVERFLIPAETMGTRRAELWQHVDELRIEPATCALLAQNGFRIGVASRSGREAIRTIMQRLDANSESMTHLVQTGIPLTLDLGAVGERRTVFTIGRDGGLRGDTFAGASKLIHVDYEVTIGDRPSTTLRITPEIFKENETPHWQLRDGGVRYQKQYEGKLYRELSAELDAADGEVLVIGPADAQDGPLMLGSTILSDVIAGRRWVTFLCVTPSLYRNVAGQGSP